MRFKDPRFKKSVRDALSGITMLPKSVAISLLFLAPMLQIMMECQKK
jgi:hypothetical protein